MSEDTVGAPSQLGGGLEPEQLAGREYQVRLAYSVEYNVTVKAGVEDNDAIEEAELVARFGDEEATVRDLVHSDVEVKREIYADDPEAHECSDWIDAPSAPGENTYYDDTFHFPELVDDE